MYTIVELVTGKTATGQPFYAYIEMNPDKNLLFRQDRARGRSIDLTRYGSVLTAGFGVEPPPHVVARMDREHNLRNDFEERLAQDVTQKLNEVRA